MDRPKYSDLLPALSALLDRVGSGPIQLSVSLTEADEVKQLRLTVEELEAVVARLKEDLNRTEYRYRCECIYTMRLTDWLRDHNIQVPAAIFTPPAES